MNKHLRDHASQEELEERHSELKASPVVTVFHDLQTITLERNITLEVHLVESLHRNLVLALVLQCILLFVELKIMFNRFAREFDLLGLPRREAGCNGPITNQDWERRNQSEKDEGLPSTTNFVPEVEGDNEERPKKNLVGEAITSGTIRWEGCICNCGILFTVVSNSDLLVGISPPIDGNAHSCCLNTAFRGWGRRSRCWWGFNELERVLSVRTAHFYE